MELPNAGRLLVLSLPLLATSLVACGGGGSSAPLFNGDDASAPGHLDATPGNDAASDGSSHDSGVDAADATSAADGNAVADSMPDSMPDAGAGDASNDAAADAADGALPADAGPTCGPTMPCAAALSCCGGHCVDTSRDPSHCGSCDVACTATQFCTGKACDDAVFANVCDNPKATVVAGLYSGDNAAGAAIGATLGSICNPSVVTNQGSQDDGGAEDPQSGAPRLGVGDTFVSGGGKAGQRAVSYMDQALATPVYLTTDGVTAAFVNRKTSAHIVSTNFGALTASHDYFLVELTVDPASGTLCFFSIGMLAPGTTAAAVYVDNFIVPNRATYTDAWYVYEWQDSGADGGNAMPDPGDTFTLIAHGKD